MILARFHDRQALEAAARALAGAGVTCVESYGPAPPEPNGHSPLPALMLGGGLAVAVGSFAMQAYAGTAGYRLDIGGRPDLFWPAYLPFAAEAGMLTAMLTGLFGFLVAAGMPALYDPVDEASFIGSASLDAWFLRIPDDAADAARDSLRSAASVETLPG